VAASGARYESISAGCLENNIGHSNHEEVSEHWEHPHRL